MYKLNDKEIILCKKKTQSILYRIYKKQIFTLDFPCIEIFLFICLKSSIPIATLANKKSYVGILFYNHLQQTELNLFKCYIINIELIYICSSNTNSIELNMNPTMSLIFGKEKNFYEITVLIKFSNIWRTS